MRLQGPPVCEGPMASYNDVFKFFTYPECQGYAGAEEQAGKFKAVRQLGCEQVWLRQLWGTYSKGASVEVRENRHQRPYCTIDYIRAMLATQIDLEKHGVPAITKSIGTCTLSFLAAWSECLVANNST